MIRIGFVLAQKTLLDCNNVKFKWPKNEQDLQQITKEQLSWLLAGLELYPKKAFKDINGDAIAS